MAPSESSGRFSRISLFEARTLGYFNYRVPGMVATPAGVIMAHAEARRGTGSDWDGIDIICRRSLDCGSSWEEPVVLLERSKFGAGTMNNASCIADQTTGQLHMLFCADYARVYHMTSEDDGGTFGEPIEITHVLQRFRSEYDWGVVAVTPGHGIQLSNGRLLAPVWLSESHTQAHRPNRCAVVYSDDHGVTWQCGGMVPPTIPCCNESEAVQLANGSVMLNMRNMGDERRRAVAYSPDGVNGWSAPTPHPQLLGPRCHASTIRYTLESVDDRNRLLFTNPDNLDSSDPNRPFGFGDRRNLTVKMSYAKGSTWPVSRVIESGWSGYSDLAIAPDKRILCIFERGALTRMTDTAEIALAQFDLTWSSRGKDKLE